MTTEKHISGSIFKPDGLYRLDWCYDDEKEEGYEEETLVDDLIDILNLFEYNCKIDDNVTLMQVLYAIKDARIVIDPLFHFNYNAHMDSYSNYTGEKSIDPNEYLEIYLTVGTEQFDKDKDGPGVELTHYHGMHLINTKSGNGIPYSVMLSPLYEIGDIPIKINTSTSLYHTNYTGNGGYEQDESKSIDTVHFTLHDVLYSVLWELGFVGDPDDKEEKVVDMNEQIEAIKDGTAVLTEVNFDELLGNDNDNTKTD